MTEENGNKQKIIAAASAIAGFIEEADGGDTGTVDEDGAAPADTEQASTERNIK